MGIARDAHEAHIATQVAEDLTWSKNMNKKGAQWGPDWWVNQWCIKVPALEKPPPREKLSGTHAGHLWPLPPGAAERGGNNTSPINHPP